jgi:hypothetical protein
MLECHPAGGALLVRAGPPDPGQQAFAAGLAADPEHAVVILDLARDYPAASWESVLHDLSSLPGSLRLVPWQPRQGGLLRIGQWLADRLERTVLAPDGQPVSATLGGLFVPPGAGTGWYRLGPGRPAWPDSRRFPRLRWTAVAPLERPVALSASTSLQPLPGGAWLYAEDGADAQDHAARDRGLWLCSHLAWSHDTISIVLGYPGSPPLLASDVARLWSTLPDEARQSVRFVRYGAAVPSGQELADTIGVRVVVRNGVAVSGWRAADPIRVAVLDGDGSPGWEPFTTEVSYLPGGVAPQPAAAVLPARLAGLAELAPCVYALGPGVVLEVVTSGLWIRPDREPPVAAAARCSPADPRHPVLWVDSALPRSPEEATATVLDALSPQLRARCQVRPVTTAAPATSTPDPAPERTGLATIRLESGPQDDTAVPEAFAVPDMSLAGALTTDGEEAAEGQAQQSVKDDDLVAGSQAEPVPAAPPEAPPVQAPAAAGPAGEDPQARVQPVPAPQASAVPPERGIAKERLWLQRALSQEYGATASSVSRVLSQTPGLRGGDGTAQDVLTDLVAVRLYLAEHGQRIDDAVRTAKVGPHVPFARCVASGLRRLPSYRGAARLRATLADAEWNWYGSRRLVTEWAFCPALTDGSITLPGAVDFLIWSMTARRTHLLAPDVGSQVLFLPGTSFKVLRVSDGQRPEVLLRELSAGEIAPDGKVETGQVPLDEVALTVLEKASDAWAHADPGRELTGGYARRFGNPPGLILGAAEPHSFAGAAQTGEGGAE